MLVIRMDFFVFVFLQRRERTSFPGNNEKNAVQIGAVTLPPGKQAACGCLC